MTIYVVSYIVIYMYEYIIDNIQQDTTTAPQPVVEAPLCTMTPGGIVMRTMVWYGRPVELERDSSAPAPMHTEDHDNGK